MKYREIQERIEDINNLIQLATDHDFPATELNTLVELKSRLQEKLEKVKI